MVASALLQVPMTKEFQNFSRGLHAKTTRNSIIIEAAKLIPATM